MFRLSQPLNEHQVVDLIESGPLSALMLYRHLPEFRVIVVGGDGSVGWVLNCLEDMREYLVCQVPAVGVLPVGTGNDLARVLGWGGGSVTICMSAL
jgi:diacylglycerol kinase (ATP)